MLESLLTDRELVGFVVAAAAIWIIVSGCISAARKLRSKDRNGYYIARQQPNGDWKWVKE